MKFSFEASYEHQKCKIDNFFAKYMLKQEEIYACALDKWRVCVCLTYLSDENNFGD